MALKKQRNGLEEKLDFCDYYCYTFLTINRLMKKKYANENKNITC